MEVILLQKIANLGNIGDRVKVKPGFGRNYLLPGGKATLATPENIARFESRRAELEVQAAKELGSAQQRAAALEGFTLTIAAKAGSEGKLFGSIGTTDIAEACAKAGHAIERSEVRLPGGPIRMVGEHVISLHLHSDVDIPVTLTVVAEESKYSGAMVAILRQDEIRTPPHSVEAEQAVLGGLMLDPNAWDAVADIVVAADFYRRDHRLIFEAIMEVVEIRGSCDAVTISEHLERKGRLDEIGGLAYLGTIARDTPSAANVRAYAEIIRERSILRQLVSAGAEIAASATDGRGRAAHELVDEAERRVFEIAERGSRGRSGFVAVRDILPQTIDRLDTLHQNAGRDARRADRLHPARPQDHRACSPATSSSSRDARRWASRRSP